jgi:hemolysin D
MKFASSTIIPFPRRGDKGREDERAFLPAALEVVETPPSPIGRGIAFTLIAVFCAALAWASFGKLDIVAAAPGKIVPRGRTKIIQPFETGVVRAIHVHDGQAVKAGELLIELDRTMNEAELDHVRADLIAAELAEARLRAALADAPDPAAAFAPPKDASPALVAMQQQYLLNQVNEHRAKLSELDRQRAQKEAERTTIAATISKIEALVPLLQQKVDVRKVLMDQALGSKITYLTDLGELVGQQQDLLVQKSRLNEAAAAVAALIEQRAQAEAEYRRDLSSDLADATQKAAGLAQDVIKAERRTGLQRLTAPIDGVVQQLAVHTVGGVVTPAQTLAVVVPVDNELEVEAMVSNRDIGFVHAGQEVEVKVDTFNFTRYGLLHGRVLSVSQDAIVHDRPQDKAKVADDQGAASSTSEPSGQELVYAARIALDRTRMRVDENLVNLTPGMAVTAEIRTGSRRVISYLLSPLTRYRHDSLRER